MVIKSSTLTGSYATSSEKYHPHYDVTNANEQYQFHLVYLPHNIFERNKYKQYYQKLTLPQDTRLLEHSVAKKQVRFHLCWRQYIKKVWCV